MEGELEKGSQTKNGKETGEEQVEVEEPSWWATQEEEILNESSDYVKEQLGTEASEILFPPEDTEVEGESVKEKEPTPSFIF